MSSTPMDENQKRARIDDGPEKISPTCHPSLWFDNGSVVLHVESTLFRVHRSTLCKHSTVFADMFSIPQPAEEDSIDGCPVVIMPDSADDFAHLLGACYDPFFFASKDKEVSTIPVEIACSVLRLSTKYHLPTFHTQSMHELKKYFPTTLDLFDSRICVEPVLTASQLILIICVGHEINALEILPCAFYFLCRCHPTALFGNTSYGCLSREDLKICVLARESLRDAHRRRAPANKPSPECITRSLCGAAYGRMAESYRQLGLLYPTAVLSRVNFGATGLCRTYVAHAQPAHDAARQEAWDKLPKWFALGTWADLLGSQTA